MDESRIGVATSKENQPYRNQGKRLWHLYKVDKVERRPGV